MDSALCRSWDATATRENAAVYTDHFASVVLPRLRSLAGFREAFLLTREEGEHVRIRALTFWDGLDAVRAFAGGDATRAAVDADARRMLRDFDATVTHFRVAVPRDAG